MPSTDLDTTDWKILDRLQADYPTLVAAMPAYPHTADRMVTEWIAFLERTLASREDLLASRDPWRRPLLTLRNLIPV